MIDVVGTADAADEEAVLNELSRLPARVLQRMKDAGVRVEVCRNSVTEAMPELARQTPRGWPPDATWDSVPGLYDPNRNRVVIATREEGGRRAVPSTGNGHGSADLVMHETLHGWDHVTHASASDAFTRARAADQAHLTAYESQAGDAGLQETLAETGARYYSGDGAVAAERPHLTTYFHDEVGAR